MEEAGGALQQNISRRPLVRLGRGFSQKNVRRQAHHSSSPWLVMTRNQKPNQQKKKHQLAAATSACVFILSVNSPSNNIWGLLSSGPGLTKDPQDLMVLDGLAGWLVATQRFQQSTGNRWREGVTLWHSRLLQTFFGTGYDEQFSSGLDFFSLFAGSDG